MEINGTKVVVKGVEGVSKAEIIHYLDHIEEETKSSVKKLTISGADDGCVALDYDLASPKFERIRRITGYLVGTIDRWNNAKQHEEHDRVKHGLAG